MILRISKLVVISCVLWLFLSGFFIEQARTVRIQWQTNLKLFALFGLIETLMSATLCLALLINIWGFGSVDADGRRSYTVQHKRTLLYSGGASLVMTIVTKMESLWRAYTWNSRSGIIISAVLCITGLAGCRTLWPKQDKKTVYGLEHGRLHLNTQVPMWMNMGYWKANEETSPRPETLAEACRDLLDLVLAEAGFPKTPESRHSRCLIDVGFGCGEQIIHLMSDKPIRRCDELWWDARHRVYFDQYVGITRDQSQCQYARERVDELSESMAPDSQKQISLFCADAADPGLWGADLHRVINLAQSDSQETWLLALDTAYHFSPSRWILINHACQDLKASFMAFDLCLSPDATTLQRIVLRSLTALLGAPWANFVTPETYHQQLKDNGYEHHTIKIVDISRHVFAPLSEYMDKQDRKLKVLGFGLGKFNAAKALFRWWGSTGVVRGVVVVAKQPHHYQ